MLFVNGLLHALLYLSKFVLSDETVENDHQFDKRQGLTGLACYSICYLHICIHAPNGLGDSFPELR